MTRSLVAAVLVIGLLATPHAARANGEPPVASALPTHFERFVLSGCSPCVKESFPVKTIVISPVKLPAFPRVPAGSLTRQGEIAFEVVRAWELGRAARQLLAVQATLSVGVASGGGFFRVGLGVLDADDVGALADAVSGMAKASAPEPAGAESVEIDFHGGSLRIGVIRIRGDAIAYVQAGQIPILMLRPVWEVPNTVFLPVSELPVLTAAIVEVAAKIRALRGG